ncbi:MAG: hypothetical protein L0Y56_19340, partial [Nitrospira sp.]|nr:hypothetical protein [Nitrospira sp.]
MVDTFRRGNWYVSTPVLVQSEAEEDPQAFYTFMMCPHPEYQEVSRETFYSEEEEREYLAIHESCVLCGGVRFRLYPTDLPPEPFDPSIPTNAAWWERLYDFGNFKILVRRMKPVAPDTYTYLSRIETASGNVHVSFTVIEGIIFSPAAVEELADLERILKLGPEGYVEFRAMREKRSSPEAIGEIQQHAETLYPVAIEI